MSLSTKLFRKLSALFVTGLLAAGTSSSLHAAQATTTISINLPQIVVLYTFDTINLEIDATAVGSLITGACSNGSEFCIRTTVRDLTGSPITDWSSAASVDADIENTGTTTSLSNTSQTVTIQNAFGVRSLGVTTYTTSIVETTDDDGAFSGPTITAGGDLAPGLTLDTGNITFDLDLSQTTGTSASVTYTITVTGV